jgi:CheY-like chemotaxis protein
MSWRTRFARQQALSFTFASALFLTLLAFAVAATVANPLCPSNTALFNPDTGSDIMLPSGFKVSVFAKGLNFPTGIAFLRHGNGFDVSVLESGHGLPSVCNEQSSFGSGAFDSKNPFTPDILVFNEAGPYIQLPGISGVEAMHQLRADPVTSSTPVSAITASVMTQDRTRIMAAGFDGFHGKPISVKPRLATMCEILDKP